MSTQTIQHLWFPWAVSASVQLALFVPLVALFAKGLAGFPARCRHALWCLVLVKALLPPSLEADWGFGRWGVEPLLQQAAHIADLFIDPAKGKTDASIPRAELGIGVPLLAQPRLHALAESIGTSAILGVFAIWSAGTMLLLAISLQAQWALARSLSQSRLVVDGPLHAALRRAAREAGLRTLPALVLDASAEGPFVCGLFRPTLVLPASLPGSLTVSELHAVLLHEAIHLRRGDLAVCWVQVFVQALFWFHPLLWIANARIDAEREFCVDESATSAGRVGVFEYARTILRIASESSAAQATALAFIGNGGSEVAARIERLLAPPANRPLAAGWLSIAVFAAVFMPMGVSERAGIEISPLALSREYSLVSLPHSSSLIPHPSSLAV